MTAVLRARIDELAGSAHRRAVELGGVRDRPAVDAAVRGVQEALEAGLRACLTCQPDDAARHLARAEAALRELANHASALHELAAARAAVDDALRSVGIADYRGVATFRGLDHALAEGARLFDAGAAVRALGVARTVRRELAALFAPGGADHACRICRGALPAPPDEHTARLAALRAAGRGALASRLACDLAAARARRRSAPRARDELQRRGQRIAKRARACAARHAATTPAPAPPAGKEP